MRMKWLAAGFVLGGIAGAVIPVIAETLANNRFYGVSPSGWLVLGCVDAQGADRTAVRMSSSQAAGPHQLQISCPP